MGYKLSYGLYIGKWVFPSPETLTIYPQPGSLLCSLLTRPLLYTLNVVPHYVPLLYTHQPRPPTRDPYYIPSMWFLTVNPCGVRL